VWKLDLLADLETPIDRLSIQPRQIEALSPVRRAAIRDKKSPGLTV